MRANSFEEAPRVVVESVTTGETAVTARVGYTGDLKRFFGEDSFTVEYDQPLGPIPDAVAAVPVLAHVCPVAWTRGADVYAPVVDERFRESLREVREVLKRQYPEFVEGGEVHADDVIDTRDAADGPFEGRGLLFSGGVDSTASYVRHREEDPTLISIQGWTIGADSDAAWGRLRTDVESFATERDLESRFVRANIRQFLDTPMLHAHYKRYLVGSWYSGVGHGIGLLALCAPLAWSEGLGHLYMAATHSEGFDQPWGSNPEIDDSVRWGPTTASHDGYELSRQEKVELIAEYVRETGASLALNTCNEGTGENCNRCEKCCRTAAGLALTGVDPNEYGFDLEDDVYQHMRERLESGAWIVDENFRYQWEDLQDHVPEAGTYYRPEAGDFFEWLADRDIEREFVERYGPPRAGRVVQAVARHTPYPVYRGLYPVYSALKGKIQ